MHLAAFVLLWHGGPTHRSLMQNIKVSSTLSSALVVKLIQNESKMEQQAASLPEKKAVAPALDITAKPKNLAAKAEPELDSASSQGYVPVGSLTRRPSPIGVIDLNVTAIDEVAIGGSIELTVLVDVDGSVADVSTTAQEDSARVFADRVAAQLRTVRFTPGEIDGMFVKSEWRITVVSEPRLLSATK